MFPQKWLVQFLFCFFPRCHRILKVYEGSKVVHFSLKADRCPPPGIFPLVDASVAACIVCRIFLVGDSFQAGSAYKMNRFFHVFLSCLRLQAPTALGFSRAQAFFGCLNQASAATDTFPIFTCPVGIIRLFKHFQTSELTACQIDPPTGRKFLPIAPAAFRMPCFQMGLLHGFFFPAVTPAQPVMAAAFFCLFYLPADGQASIPAPVRSSLTYSTSPADIMGIMSYPPVLFFL